jgi:hypothetical protein
MLTLERQESMVQNHHEISLHAEGDHVEVTAGTGPNQAPGT